MTSAENLTEEEIQAVEALQTFLKNLLLLGFNFTVLKDVSCCFDNKKAFADELMLFITLKIHFET